MNSKENFLFDVIIEPLTLYAYIFFSSGALLIMIGPDGQVMPSMIQFVWVIIYLFIGLILVRNYRVFNLSISNNYLLIIISMFALLSVFWSIDKQSTIMKSIALLIGTLYALFSGYKYGLDFILKVLVNTSIVLIVISLIIVFIKPEFGVHTLSEPNTGDWRGAFHHKNIFARALTFFLVVYVTKFLKSKNWVYLILIIVSSILVFLSDSKSALVNVVLIFPLSYVIGISKIAQGRIRLSAIFLIIILVVTGYLATIYWKEILELLGKNETLTGRTLIWFMIYMAILNKPLLGYGYGAFWNSSDNIESFKILEDAGWNVTHSHNGFLELAVNLGVFGLCIFIIQLYKYFKKIQNQYSTLHGSNVFILFFGIFYCITNLTQSFFMSQNNLYWFTFVFSYSVMSKNETSTLQK